MCSTYDYGINSRHKIATKVNKIAINDFENRLRFRELSLS